MEHWVLFSSNTPNTAESAQVGYPHSADSTQPTGNWQQGPSSCFENWNAPTPTEHVKICHQYSKCWDEKGLRGPWAMKWAFPIGCEQKSPLFHP